MKRSDVKVRTYGCLAIIIGLFELDLTLRGEGLSEQSRFHSVWAKRSQGLQFVFWQSTRALLSSNLSVRRWASQTPSRMYPETGRSPTRPSRNRGDYERIR